MVAGLWELGAQWGADQAQAVREGAVRQVPGVQRGPRPRRVMLSEAGQARALVEGIRAGEQAQRKSTVWSGRGSMNRSGQVERAGER